MEKSSNVNKEFFLIRLLKMIGPGIIVAASIVGPGTVTTSSSAGADYGYTFLWCALLTPFLAYILHEPGIRFALKTDMTMLEGTRVYISPLVAKITFIAIFVGALAYQTGNYVGAAMAINLIIPGISIQNALIILSIGSIIIAFIGKYDVLEKFTTFLVAMMVLSFVITMFASRPNVLNIASGFVPRIPSGAELIALGLVGTTICPDIPFALSSMTKKKWKNGTDDLKAARDDLRFSMVITGIITCAIIISSATVLNPRGISVNSAADMAMQLVPFLGRYAGVLFALGLWAAGFSSAIYMTSCIPPMLMEAFDTKEENQKFVNRLCVAIIAAFPIVVSTLFGSVPVGIIISAQVLNTFILPVTVIIFALLSNKKSLLGKYSNRTIDNIGMGLVAITVLLITIAGIPSVISALGSIF